MKIDKNMKVSIGHCPPTFRCGKWQDKRNKRQNTRSAQIKKALKSQED